MSKRVGSIEVTHMHVDHVSVGIPSLSFFPLIISSREDQPPALSFRLLTQSFAVDVSNTWISAIL